MVEGGAILVIGNEILSGKVRDSNSPYLIGELRALGFQVQRVVVIPDDVEVIAHHVKELSDAFSQVFTTGGVGPTLDDLTFEGVARAFGVGLEREARLAEIITNHYGERTTEAHLKMAAIPGGARLTWSEGLPWPVVEVRNVLVLPGDPTILRKKFGAIRERFRQRPWHLRRVFTLLEEGDLSATLDELQLRHPGLGIGSYPVYEDPEYKVQITLESKEPDVVERALDDFRHLTDASAIVRIE